IPSHRRVRDGGHGVPAVAYGADRRAHHDPTIVGGEGEGAGGGNAGASRPGSVAFTVGVKGALVPPGVVMTTGCGPVATLDGAWAFTCKGLMKSTNVGWPPMVTVSPPRAVGAALPLKSAAVQVWETTLARLVP